MALRAALLSGAPGIVPASLKATQHAGTAPGAPVLIFGALADKKWEEICRILAPIAAKVFTVPVTSERTANAAELAATFRAARPALDAIALPSLTNALSACNEAPFVVITGSLYLVGEALEQLGYSPANAGERGLNEWTAPKIQQ
jgi:folylpolyglutamate synthase/dihydropteroate synthase